MNYKVGDTGFISWADSTKSKVIIKEINHMNFFVNADIWLDYEEGETNRPLIHEMYEDDEIDYVRYPILTWAPVLDKVFTKD